MDNNRPKLVFITYGDEKYEKAKRHALKMALKKGRFDKAIGYGPKDIGADFKKAHGDILSIKTGGGLWLWKPYILLDALNQQNEGDIVFYSDAGAYFIKNCRKLLRGMGKENVWVSEINFLEKQFTKAAAFELMGCAGQQYKEAHMLQAGFVGIRKTPQTMQFVKEWLDYCCDPRILLDKHPIDNTYVEDKDFIEHRRDQSVLSLLRTKWGIAAHKDPTQFVKMPPSKFYTEHRKTEFSPQDTYPPVIVLHRTMDNRFLTRLNIRLCIIMPKKWIPVYLKIETVGGSCWIRIKRLFRAQTK